MIHAWVDFQPRWPTSINAKVPAILKALRVEKKGPRTGKKSQWKPWHPQLRAINYNFRMLSCPQPRLPCHTIYVYPMAWPSPVSSGFMMLMEKILATAWLQGVRQFPAHASVSVSVSVSVSARLLYI